MDIPLNVDVFAQDELVGRSKYIIVDPVTQTVTHIVLRENSAEHTERLLPVSHIQDSDADTIQLDCTKAEAAQLEPFQEVEFLPTSVPQYQSATLPEGYAWPYVTAVAQPQVVEVVHRHIPPHERAVRRGAQVHAKDGHIGQIDEVVVDTNTQHLTHLVLREGHLWGKKDIMIPIDKIDTFGEDDIYLKLSKQEIETLPTFPVHHHIKH